MVKGTTMIMEHQITITSDGGNYRAVCSCGEFTSAACFARREAKQVAKYDHPEGRIIATRKNRARHD
jgi:hypothetical protein